MPDIYNTLTVRCAPFSSARGARRVIDARVRVSEHGDVTVWDDVAGHYTRLHSLSARTCARIRRLAADQAVR
jgi:hypothetical protein